MKANFTASLRIALFTTVFVIHHPSFVLAQGSLTPPGAPAPTMKTLDQVEPRKEINATNTPGTATALFRIAQAGSYYLSANVTGVSAKHGIEIAASDVTLDLNGFALVGVGGSLSGVSAPAVLNLTVRNGSVRTWGQSGVSASSATASVIEDLRLSNNGGGGLVVGDDANINRCTARANTGNGMVAGTSCRIIACLVEAQGGGGNGIQVSNECVFADCTVTGNQGNGIQMLAKCSLTNCVSARNSDAGFTGSNGCTLSNCSGSDNLGDGFHFLDAATLQNCAAFSNSGTGISLRNGGTVSGGNASFNEGAAGISLDSGCTISGCSLYSNTSSSSASAGIVANTQCRISQCVVGSSASTAAVLTNATGMGINVAAGSTVEHCTVRRCSGDGIRVSGSCLVLGNACDDNGSGVGADGAGIHSTSTENRLESNSVSGNDRGIDVDSTGSLIIKNSAATNTTDYVIAASNRYGAIINITAAGAAAVNGNAAASTLTSTDPWANYSY